MGAKKSRKSPRAQVSLVARYRSPTAFEFVTEECFDLSAGGMFIKSSSPAPAGTLIKLECDVDDGAAKIRGVARVVWLRDHSEDGHPAGMGVKFVKLDPGGRDVINGILARSADELDEGGEARRSQRPMLASAPMASAAAAEVTDGSDAITVRPPPAVAAVVQARAAVTAQPPVAPNGAGGDASAAQTLPTASDASPQERAPGAAAAAPASTRDATAAPAAAARPAPPATVERPKPAERAKSASGSGPAQPATAAIVRPAPGPPRQPAARSAREVDRTRRPMLYAAAILLGVAAVYALTRRPERAAEARDDEPPPEATAAPATALASTDPHAPLPASIAPSARPATEETAAAAPAPSVPEAEPQAAPRYVLEVVTRPEGARVTIGPRTLVAPGKVDLGELAEPVQLRAEKDGYTPAGITIDRLGFMLDEGAMRRRVILKLNEAPPPEAPKPAERSARTSRPKRAAPEPAAQPDAAPELAASTPTPASEPTPDPSPAPPPAAADKADKSDKKAGKQSPMQTAMECLAAGDNACVIKALEGKARTAQELELLIETFRTIGNGEKSEKYMKVYVDKYPSERRTASYRRVLERQNAAP